MEAAEAETQRLREGVARLRGENARCMKEREDIAAALSQFMGEVLKQAARAAGMERARHAAPNPTPAGAQGALPHGRPGAEGYLTA